MEENNAQFPEADSSFNTISLSQTSKFQEKLHNDRKKAELSF